MFVDMTDASGVDSVHAISRADGFVQQPLLPYKLSMLGTAVAWGDANGDGRDDLFVGGGAGQPGRLWLATDDNAFSPTAGPWEGDSECEDAAALWFDCDVDGYLDLCVASGGASATPDDGVLLDRLYVNSGEADFSHASKE